MRSPKRYGFQFFCHALDHPNRKAGNERSFRTVETNFLPGRTFESLEDLNEQAKQWATERMEYSSADQGTADSGQAVRARAALSAGTPRVSSPRRTKSISAAPISMAMWPLPRITTGFQVRVARPSKYSSMQTA